MHKSIAFCAAFLAFFMSVGVLAQTTNASPSSTVTVKHTGTKCARHAKKVKKHTTTVSNKQVAPAPVTTSKSATIIDPAYKSYIDSLAYPQSTKDLLYDYAATDEGQKVFHKITTPSLVGPTASSIASPIAFAADWGMISAGVGYANHWPGTTLDDGLAGVSVGFGDAEEYVGLTVSALIDSINPDDGGFGDTGTIAAELFHVFPHDFALAVGAGNIIPWGDLKHDATSYFAVGTKVFDVAINERSMPLTLSLGAGTGAFYSVDDAQHEHDSNLYPFASAGWRIFPQFSVIGEWVAKEANFGVSLVPIPKFPLVLTAAECNVAHNDGKSSYFLASLGVGYTF